MKTRRLFFALWPTDQVRHAIAKTLSQLSPPINGRIMPSHNLHLTLHFVGSVSDEAKDCMHLAARSIKANSFEINLDRFAGFPKAKIFWMGCQDVPDELLQLHQTLGEMIENCGYQHEKREYVPHVTLMKKCLSPVSDLDVFSIPWSVDAFALIESTSAADGVNYQVIEKYSLA